MSDTAPAPAQARWRWTPIRVFLGLIVLLMLAMWVYAFSPWSGGSIPTDKQWGAANERLCAPVLAAINELPRANTAKTPEERAQVLDQANGLVAGLVTQLNAQPPPRAVLQKFATEWLADWDSYLGSRRDYAAKLHTGHDAKFAVEATSGTPITIRMDDFADRNAMPSCKVPPDV